MLAGAMKMLLLMNLKMKMTTKWKVVIMLNLMVKTMEPTMRRSTMMAAEMPTTEMIYAVDEGSIYIWPDQRTLRPGAN